MAKRSRVSCGTSDEARVSRLAESPTLHTKTTSAPNSSNSATVEAATSSTVVAAASRAAFRSRNSACRRASRSLSRSAARSSARPSSSATASSILRSASDSSRSSPNATPTAPIARESGTTTIDSTPASSCSMSGGYSSRTRSRPWSSIACRARMTSAVGVEVERGTGRQCQCSRAQVRGNLQRPHVVARSDPDGAQRRIEGLEQERDARFRDLGRKCRRREARDEPLQDVRPAPPFVVDRAEPGALERDAALLCDPDDDGLHVGDEPAGPPRARDECADDRSVGAEERHGERRRERGAVRVRLRRLHDAAGSHRLFRNCVRRVDVLGGADRGQRLDRVAPPHAHGGHLDSGPREIGDGRSSDLLRAGGGREVRGVALQQLRALASGALGIVGLPQAPLGRGARQRERTEHDREDRPSDEDRERRGMRGVGRRSR